MTAIDAELTGRIAAELAQAKEGGPGSHGPGALWIGSLLFMLNQNATYAAWVHLWRMGLEEDGTERQVAYFRQLGFKVTEEGVAATGGPNYWVSA